MFERPSVKSEGLFYVMLKLRCNMINFLIENTKYDFAHQLIQSIEFNNWYRGEKELDYKVSEDISIKDMIPIGSLEFVSKYMEKHYGKSLGKPIHIPKELFKDEFLLRRCGYASRESIVLDEKMFVKSVDRYKGFLDFVSDINDVPEGNYFFSEIVEIKAEYRCFIYKGEFRGMHFYAGDFRVFPDIEKIELMIKSYVDAPVAYTLDVGVGERGTFIIEVHPLVSCGLYGFRDNALPYMLSSGFKHLLK